MHRTTRRWIIAIILLIIGGFIAGVVSVGYYNYLNGIEGLNNSKGGFISGLVMGSLFIVPALILVLVNIRWGILNTFDLRLAKILEEYDRITPIELSKKANSSEAKIERSVSRIIEKGIIIVYFDKVTGEFVTQEGRAIAERIIGIINSKRRVTLEELVNETGMTVEEIKRIVVGMEKRGLFNGTYDWKSGKILSQEGTKQLSVAKTSCPNCGGKLEEPPLPGEEIPCEYCGKIITG